MEELKKIVDKHTEGNYLISESDKEKMSEDILNLFDVSGCTQCEIVDARNEIIESGYICIKCHKLFKAYDH